MPVRVERSNRVLTVVHSRPEARNAVDPKHAEALYEAFLAFDRQRNRWRTRSRDSRRPVCAPIGTRSICSKVCPCARRLRVNGRTASAWWRGRRAPRVSPRGAGRHGDFGKI